MNTEEMIKVMQAYVDIKEIEWRTRTVPSNWNSTTDPAWDWANCEYRIKPQVVTKEMYLFPNGSMSPTDMYGYDLTTSRWACKKVTITYTI